MSETTKTPPPETTEREILETGEKACAQIVDEARAAVDRLDDPEVQEEFFRNAVERMGMLIEGMPVPRYSHHKERLNKLVTEKQTLVENAENFLQGDQAPQNIAAVQILAVDKMMNEDPTGEEYLTAFTAFAYTMMVEMESQN